MKRFVRIVLLTFNITFMVLLLLSYLGGLINPSTRIGSVLYFFTLAYPVLILLNLVFVFFWIYRKRWFFVMSLLVIGLGYKNFYNTFPINFSKSELPPPNCIKVFSYNVGGFYRGEGFNETINGIFDLINDQHPDIVCLQEVNLVNNSKYTFTESELFDKLSAYPNKSIQYVRIGKRAKHANVIFSKFPIVKKGTVKVQDDAMLDIGFVDVMVSEKRIRIFSPHLNPNRLKVINKDFYESMSTKNQEDFKGEVKYIAESLGKAARTRGQQVELFKEEVKASPFPVIIAGDFNDSPATFTYKHMAEGMVDAKLKNQSGLGATYNGNYPSFRIDMILHSPCMQSYDYRKFNRKYSDHDAISCLIDISGCN